MHTVYKTDPSVVDVEKRCVIRWVAYKSVCYIYGGDGGCFGSGGRIGGRREYHPRVALAVWVIINDENWTFIERRVRVSEICVCVHMKP